jgi:hypothetical protein
VLGPSLEAMYLVTLFENESMVEASLGGRVTADEMRVFADELNDLLETFEGRPFNLMLDYSKAACFDHEAVATLSAIKDQCLEVGASKIVSIPRNENDMVLHTSERLQHVLEGREEFVADPAAVQFPAIRQAQVRRCA